MKYPQIDVFEVVISNQCNLECKYCFVHQQPQTMSINDIQKVINFIQQYPNKTEEYKIHLFGGECLLHKDLIKYFIQEAPFAGHPIIIFTNCVLLDEEFLLFCREYKDVTFNFSLDGCQLAHDTNRIDHFGQGSFEKVLQNLKLYEQIYRHRRINTYVKAVLTTNNSQYLIETLKDPCLKNYIIDFTIDREAHWTQEDLNNYQYNLQQAADYYIEHFNEIPKTNLFTNLLIILQHQSNSICSAVGSQISQLTIAPDLQLYTCAHFINTDLTIGSVATGILLQGSAYQELITVSFDTISNCRNCSTFLSHNCWGNCPAAVYETFNILYTTNPMICELIKIHCKICQYVYNKLKYNSKYRELIAYE